MTLATRVKLAVVNDSSVLTDEEVESYAVAYHKQVRDDMRHHWLVHALVYFSPVGQSIAPDTWVVRFQDTLDVSGALGYHDLSDRDVPVSLIGAKLDLDNGYSPSVTGSHEVCEMLVDPFINEATQIGDSTFLATEVCDPCEADEYGYRITDHVGNKVLVSDFITPHWFQPGAPPPYDFAGHHDAPLTLLPGGYTSYWTPDKGWQQAFAERADEASDSSHVASVRARNSLRSWGRAATRRNERPSWLVTAEAHS